MEDWKIKISMLWLFASIAFLAHQILVLMEPGIIAHLMAGEAEGQKIGPELILFFAILMLVPMLMAFLSLTLKDSMKNWNPQQPCGSTNQNLKVSATLS